MPHRRSRLGRWGEGIAARYLEAKGYRIIERNARTASGEIDLVAINGSILVIVEVRTRRGRAYGTAAESITFTKRAKLRQVTAEYAQSHPDLPSDVRIDVVTVELGPAGEMVGVEILPAAVGEE